MLPFFVRRHAVPAAVLALLGFAAACLTALPSAAYAVEYALTVNTVGSGSVSKDPDQATYEENTSVDLTAVPGSGYSFTGWSGDATGSDNPLSLLMDGDKTVTATFTIDTYSVSTSVVGVGTVTRDPDQASYDHGTSVELTATPGFGYHFVSWSGDTTGTANPFSVILHEDKSYTATFAINTYTLSTAVVGSGSVALNPTGGTYNHGTSVVVTATPGIGYHLVSWSGDTTGTANPFTVILHEDKSYTATFAINTYTLSTSVVGSGSVTRNPSQATYDYGTSVVVTATPGTGYSFTGWSGDTTGTMNPFTKIMNGNKSYTATFTINTHTLSTAVVGSGSVALNPTGGTYDYGTSVVVTATPGIGYHLVSWSGDTTGTANPFTVILHEDKSYTATFAINTYTLSTAVVGSGSVTRNPSQATYDYGTSVVVTAVPSFGYHFVSWSGDTTGTMNPFTKIMNGNKSYTATFAINTYTVSTAVVGSGTVSKSPNQATYDHGTSVQLTATPSFGYHFVSWSGDTTDTSNPFDVILHEDKSYTATFAINTYTLSTAVVGSGSVALNPTGGTYNHGTSVVVTATPGIGYHLVSWSGDTTGTANPFTVILHEDKSYTATFAINTYTLSTAVVGSGSVTRNPSQATYDYGTSVVVTAVPSFGYHFVSWSGDTTGTMNPFTKIMNGNKSYTATFAINTYTLSTAVVGSGSVALNPTGGTYNHGTSVVVTATPGIGYHLVSWSGDTTGTANPFTVILHEDKSYTATFAINTYTLSTAVVGSGSVTRNPSQATYDYGTSVVVTAIPGTGYSFTGWSGDTTGSMNPFTKIMNGNKSYTATFTINSYTLSTAVVGSGSVALNPTGGTYTHGTSVVVTATPGTGYSFTGWSGDTTGSMNPFTVILHEDKSYTATFAINTYTLSTAVVGSGSVALNPTGGTYNHGTSVVVTATPGIGYHLVSWSGDTTGTANPFTVILHEDKSYTATFAINTYTLSTAVVGSGSVTRDPSQALYDYGTSVGVTAVPSFGYHFVSWSGDTTGTMNPFTKIMNGNKSYTATFAINTYTLSTAVVGSGSVALNPTGGTYNHGTSVVVTATPGIGYHLVSWSGDTTGTANPFTVILHEDKSYTATFAINTYTLSTAVVGSGSVTRNPSQALYDYGTSVVVTAVPSFGYHFVSWSGDTTGTMNPFTKIMNGNKSYTATFAINTYTLSTAVVGSGSVALNPTGGTYNHGTSVVVTATPGIGYHLVSWSGDTTGTANPFTVILHEDKSYTATFAINTYTLSTAVVGSGSVTRNPSQALYDYGTSVVVTAVPSFGYHFVSWSGDTTGTMNPFTKIMNGNKSYTATFAINTYTLSTAVVGSGSVGLNPTGGTYNHGTSVVVTATPGTGYSFTGWSGDTTGTTNPFTVILHEDKSYTATFTINSYTLSTAVVGSGSVALNPTGGTYNHGTSVVVTAVPSFGHHFVSWSGDTTGTMNPFTKIMNGNKSYTATFAINTYTLSTAVVGSGSVALNPTGGTYNHGTSVVVTATPGIGYHLVSWSGDTTGTANPFTVILHEDKSYTATFAINTYTLSTAVVGNGSVTRNPSQALYDYGTSVVVTAVPSFGYHFVSWSGDTTGTMNPFTKIMNGNKSYTATFAINTYTLSTAVVGSGSVALNPTGGTYNHGTSVVVTATPGIGYHLVSWSGDTTGTANPFTVILHEDKSYTATFAINTYTLSTAVVGSGSVTRNPSQALYDYGTSVQVTAVPSFGYTFTGWSGDTTGTMNPFTKIMNGNKSYTATFTINSYTLSTAVVGSGSVGLNPTGGTYNHGTSVVVTATPGTGYSFTGWSGDTTGTTNPFTVILHEDKSYTATFTINSYTLSTAVVGSGSVTRTPSQASYTHGTSVVVTAVPSFGYHFVSWSGDTTGTMNPFTKIMNGNKSYTATFAINTYTLSTAVVGSGSVALNPTGGTYNHGTSVVVTATPGIGYHFVSWSGDTTGTTNPFTVILHEDKSYTATFAINTYTLSTAVVGNGSVTRNPSQALYDYGTSVVVTAVPSFGYHFVSWSGDTTGTMNPFTKIMNGNKSYTATFAINTYTLSTAVVGSGSVALNPTGGTYNHGTSVVVTATPGTGYSFTGWSGDTTGTTNPFTVILHEDKNYTATFTINSYTLSTAVVGSGSVALNPTGGTYTHGTSVVVTATPGTGYSFTGWSGDTTGTMNPFTKIMNGNKSYTATFTINSYTLTATPIGGGTITKSPDQPTYTHGTVVQVTAVPSVGWTFDSWGGDLNGAANPRNITMNANKNITATFTINSYTLSTAVIGSGSVALNPTGGTYTHGTSVQVTATPGTGYSFTGWSGDTTGTMNPFTKIMNGNKSYTATFTINSYTLSTAVVGSGSVTRNPSQASYTHGTSVVVTAVPGVGYSFTGWSGDTTGTMNPFTKIMNGNKSYTATFTINSYTLSTAVVGSGSVALNPTGGTYTHGTSVVVTATPGTGYSFTGWSGDTTGTMNPFTKIMNGNKSYTATFTINSYTLSTAVVGSGSVTRNPSQASYAHGTSVVVTAVPNTGYSFTGWSGDTTGTMNPFTKIMNGNKSYTATFTINTYTLSTAVVGGGSVALNPTGGTYAHGTSVVVTATPGTGYSFTGWSGDTTGTMNPFSVILHENKSYTVTFTINSYTLSTAVVGSGSVTRNPSQASYTHGTSVVVTAVPNIGYSFTGWSGDTTGTMNPFTKIMNGNKSYTATFTINTYTIATSVVGSGTVTKNPNLASYAHGTSVQLTATPSTGYSFTGWSGDTTGLVNPFNVILHQNKSYTATFTINSYTLSVSVVGSGTLSINPPTGPYTHGTVVQLTATPSTGYSFTGWSGDTTTTQNPLTIVMTRNRSVTATFTINSYALTVNTVGSGTVTKNPDQATYVHGTVVQLTANAGVGYTFTGWSGAATGLLNPVNVTMDAPKTVTATFTINSYTLTVNAVGNGNVVKSPDQPTYTHGTVVQLTVAPAPCYQFMGWSGDTTFTGNPMIIVMTRNRTVTATFAIYTYALTVNTVGSGSVARNPDLPAYNCGAVVALTATPAPFWNFAGWSGDATGMTNPVNVTMNGPRTVTATFTINTYALTVETNGNGTVTRDPNLAAYPHGSTVQITAVPATGWSFTGWSGDATGLTNPTDVLMEGPRSVTATFSINTYTLTLNTVGNGTVAKNPDQPTYPHGTIVQLTAQPTIGWSFTGWSGSASGTTNPLNVTMNGPKSITATFVINSYALNVTVLGGGTVTKSPNQPTYTHGTVVQLTATPNPGNGFGGWSGSATGFNNPLTVVMDGVKNITATFAINSYILTINTVGSGTVSRIPMLPAYPHGTTVELTAEPGPGYYFVAWSGDLKSAENPLSIVMDGYKTVTAHFQPVAVAVELPQRFLPQAMANHLDFPVGMAFLPDGRLLFVEKESAKIRMIVNGGLGLVDPVAVVDSVGGAGGEAGLLGIAVDPNWPIRPDIYVFYTALGGSIRISRLTGEGTLNDGTSSDLTFPASSRRDILRDLRNQSPIHNGGTLRFGPDGYLYTALGDDNAPCFAQDPSQVVGAVLRMDVSSVSEGPGPPPDRASLVPPGNPYVTNFDPTVRLVWSTGLRNPFRFHIDPASGGLFIADVGEELIEEVTYEDGPGLNHGWPYYEGTTPWGNACDPIPGGTLLEPPIYWYNRSMYPAASVISGGVYRQIGCSTCDFPAAYEGDYFVSDFYEGFLRRLKYSAGTWSIAPPVLGQPSATDWGRGFKQVSDYLVGPDGALWYCRMSVGYQNGTGEIAKIYFQQVPTDVEPELSASPISFAPPWPSPSRGAVNFAFSMASPGRAELTIYDLMGRVRRRLMRDSEQGSGRHTLNWDGRGENGESAAPGVYLARLIVDGVSFTRRVVITH